MPHDRPDAAAEYVDRVLELYRRTPGTLGHVRPADRRLAASLRARSVPLQTVQAALLLASARRAFRPPSAQPLAPIASLHYFLHVINELLAAPLETAYLDHLRRRMARLAPSLVAPEDHQTP